MDNIEENDDKSVPMSDIVKNVDNQGPKVLPSTDVQSDEKLICYECQECNRQFKTRASLRVHSKIHNTEKSRDSEHQCDYCDRKFDTNKGLNVHARVHSMEKSKANQKRKQKTGERNKCDKCNFKCISKYAFETHMEIVHTSIRITSPSPKRPKGNSTLEEITPEQVDLNKKNQITLMFHSSLIQRKVWTIY